VDQAPDHTLDLHCLGGDQDGLVSAVLRLQPDHVTLAVKALERGLTVLLEPCRHHLPIPRLFHRLHNDDVAVFHHRVLHRVTFDLQRKQLFGRSPKAAADLDVGFAVEVGEFRAGHRDGKPRLDASDDRQALGAAVPVAPGG
jgi:hypothetical protein